MSSSSNYYYIYNITTLIFTVRYKDTTWGLYDCTAELLEALFWRIVDSLELAEDISVLRWDAIGLQHSNTEGKDAADLQLSCETVTKTQLGVFDVVQFEV